MTDITIKTSRRALLAGVPAAALVVSTPAFANALSEPAPAAADAELLDLCRRTIEQSECWAQADLIQDRLNRDEGPFRPELEDQAIEAYERAELEFERLSELYSAVINTPALTNEGIHAKAAVVFQACWGAEHLEDIDDLVSTTDAKVALSMVRDLINRGHPSPRPRSRSRGLPKWRNTPRCWRSRSQQS
jgi:hypothetical protein